jgi:circadian clock protein KaiB
MTKTRRRGKRGDPRLGREVYVFRLFMAGNETNSAQALVNLVRLCDEHIAGRYKIHTVDVLKNTAVAYANNVLVTPTLILLKPLPAVTVFGNLRDPQQVAAALRLTGER